MKDNVEALTKLGSKETKYNYDNPTKEILEIFPNQFPDRDYETKFIFPEFTSCCPKTGQPDFATITLSYVADKSCIETKSLKLYYLAFRQHAGFMETITNTILEDCVAVCQPREMTVKAIFNPRGGTGIEVEAKYSKKAENGTS